MPLPPRPPPVSCVWHAQRVLGWLLVLEFFGGFLTAGELAADSLLWLALAAALYGGVALGVGLALDRVPGLRQRPVGVLLVLYALLLGVIRWVEGDLLFAWVPSLPVFLSYLRWRFPGQPSRGRTLFRGAMLAAVVLGLLALAVANRVPRRYASGAYPSGPSILLVVLDTVRRDHTSTYGYGRDTTPNLDALARRGTTYQAWSNACWTLPSHATLLTGRYSGAHGANYEGGALRDGETTLVPAMERHGYDTLAITGNPWIRVGNGVGDDFGTLVESWSRFMVPNGFLLLRATGALWDRDGDKGGAAGVRAFARWLDGRPDPQRPFFALVNIIEAHAPYHRVHPADRYRYLPDDMDREAAEQLSIQISRHHVMGTAGPQGAQVEARVTDLYDGAVRGADRLLGTLLEALQQRGLAEETLLVVLSDHGEYLGEHQLWGHAHGLFEPVLQVPLVMVGPGAPAGERSPVRAQLVDVAPTLLQAAGIPRGEWPAVHGEPLQQASQGQRPVYAEQFIPFIFTTADDTQRGDLQAFRVRRRSWLQGANKLLMRQDVGVYGYYDLAQDPGEQQDLAAERPQEVEASSAALEEHVRGMVSLYGENAGDSYGTEVAMLGDINGDGVGDFAVSAVYADVNGVNDAGRTYIYAGGNVISKNPVCIIDGRVPREQIGYRIYSPGDITGDGFADVLIGAPGGGSGGIGAVYVIAGGKSVRNEPVRQYFGPHKNSLFGTAVYSAGDINGDGATDIMVGAPYTDAGHYHSGRVEFYAGGKDASVEDIYHLNGDKEESQCGFAVIYIPNFFGRNDPLYAITWAGPGSGNVDISEVHLYRK